MLPTDYSVYFTTMATVGATLFGLIFVAISIAPESVAVKSAPLERQVKAFAAKQLHAGVQDALDRLQHAAEATT